MFSGPLAKLITLGLAILICHGCSVIPPQERPAIRQEINSNAAELIKSLQASHPEFSSLYDSSVGYMAATLSETKVPVAGGGFGFAVVEDFDAGTRRYLTIKRLELGAGLGQGTVRAIVLFDNHDDLRRFSRGTFEPIAKSSTYSGTGNVLERAGDGFHAFLVADRGASLTATVALLQTSLNEDLTDTGISEISVPNTRIDDPVKQEGPIAPREWDRRFPFLAQSVVDKGYDLPLPYGGGLTYSYVDQDQLLSSLQVGINGSPVVPLNFVSFDNATSQSNSTSIKADLWLFPFMNVFAMLGRVDGEAPVDVLLDGNTILENQGADCSSPIPNPLCGLLQDRTITLPIEARFDGTTYGLGTTLAGGWNNWFVTLPFNWTYADMENSKTDGASFTATPRVGRLWKLGRRGNVATFVGANYLDTDLTINGVAQAKEVDLSFEYIVDQENKDQWNALIGFNWDINKRVSWSAEYDGFTGSREAFITSLVYRF